MSPSGSIRQLAVCLALAVLITNTSAFAVRRTTTIKPARESFEDEIRNLRLKENPPVTNTPHKSNSSEGVNVTITPSATAKIKESTMEETVNPSSLLNKVTTDKITTTLIDVTEISETTQTFNTKNFEYDEYTTPQAVSSDLFTSIKPMAETAKNKSSVLTSKKMLIMKNISPFKIENRKVMHKNETVIQIKGKQFLESNDKKENKTIFESQVTLHPWKKYTVIIRNRTQAKNVDISDVKNKDKEFVTTRDLLQSASSLRDTIKTDDELKNDHISVKSKIRQDNRSALDINSDITEQLSNTKLEDHFPIEYSTSMEKLNKWDTFESKRAGFLNLSDNKKPEVTDVTKDDNKAVTIYSIKAESNRNVVQEEPPKAMGDFEAKEKNIRNNPKLFEDPVNSEVVATEYTNFGNMNTEVIAEVFTNPTDEKIQDKLSLTEKSKNASLYTVSPNYKPLKKLEVQQPKLFVRDPDDNSWRNESISSLGIVFKAKNSSKPFTQVLKNKTEVEWNSLLDKDPKNDVPQLRERLEQMAKMRKTKKKKIDSLGNVVYVDYEENSSSNENNSYSQENIPFVIFKPKILIDANPLMYSSTLITQEPDTPPNLTTPALKNIEMQLDQKPKKKFKLPDYYESPDEDETEYLNLAKIDIKKFTVTQKTTVPLVESTWPSFNYKTTKDIIPDRHGTIQYFPPLTTKKTHHKFTSPQLKDSPKASVTTTPVNNIFSSHHRTSTTGLPLTNMPTTIENSLFLTQPPRMESHNQYKVINDEGNLKKGSYVIKSYAEYVNEAAKDYDRNVDYLALTDSPLPSITANEVVKEEQIKENLNFNEDIDYEAHFRKDVLNRFVDNFNRNSDRLKPEFPVIFNNSIVHHSVDGGSGVASSRSFLRGLYELATKANSNKPYDPSCENATVELQPAYELQYYVPEQEEKEEIVTLPYRYKL